MGAVEILVTNTGGPPSGDSLGFERPQWEAAYRSLVLAPMALIEAVVPAMREAGWGRIVNVTSIADEGADPGLDAVQQPPAGGGRAFKTLARELARDGILFNSVAPWPHRDRPDRAIPGRRSRSWRRAAARRPRRPAGASRSSPTWSRSCARSARRTSAA